MHRHVLIGWALVVSVVGCSSSKNSLLLERPARGPLAEVPTIAHRISWKLDPEHATQTEKLVEFSVTHASETYLKEFFSNRAIFGPHAGINPYQPVHLVFYVNVANRGGKPIHINPAEFVLVDDHGNQYHTLGQDYVTAFTESRKSVGGFTRDIISDARPGYFGFSVPVGKMLMPAKSSREMALLLQSALKPGPLFPGAVYDGLVAFWSPSVSAKTLRLVIPNVKTDFDADEVPRTSLEFTFEFRTVGP